MGMESSIRIGELSPILSTGGLRPETPGTSSTNCCRWVLSPKRGLNLNPGLSMVTEAHLQ